MRLPVCRLIETFSHFHKKQEIQVEYFCMNNEILIKFGQNLRKMRTDQNISQEDMALEIGFDRTYISLLERGKRNPSLITVCRLVAYLKVDINQLFENFDAIMKDFKWQKEGKIK